MAGQGLPHQVNVGWKSPHTFRGNLIGDVGG
jgi:hypothetical protein